MVLASSTERSPTLNSARYVLKADRFSSHSVILDNLPQQPGQVLDIGAADGYLAQSLTHRGFEVTAIEGDASLAAHAAAYCREVFVVDLDQPLPDIGGPFDVAIFGDVLEHVKDPLLALAQVSRHVRAGGTLIISVPNVAHLWIRLQLLRGNFDYADRGILDRSHLRFFTRKSFREFLCDAGVEMLKMTCTPVPLPLAFPRHASSWWLRAAHRLDAMLAQFWPTLFAYQFVAVARRSTVK